MVPGDMYKWSGGIFAKKTKFHDAGGPGTVVSPNVQSFLMNSASERENNIDRSHVSCQTYYWIN